MRKGLHWPAFLKGMSFFEGFHYFVTGISDDDDDDDDDDDGADDDDVPCVCLAISLGVIALDSERRRRFRLYDDDDDDDDDAEDDMMMMMMSPHRVAQRSRYASRALPPRLPGQGPRQPCPLSSGDPRARRRSCSAGHVRCLSATFS